LGFDFRKWRREEMGMDPFEFLAVSEAEAAELLDSIEDSKVVRDRRICICGHPIVRHKFREDLGYYVCEPNAAGCKCNTRRAVLEVGDLRKFLRSTKGMGSSHALTQGMVAAKQAGVEMDWVDGVAPSCDKCGASGVKVIPAPVSPRGEILDKTSAHNVFLCAGCLS
jgi:hypothetical protein